MSDFYDSPAAMRYMHSVDGKAHMSAVEIIMEQEEREQIALQALRDIDNPLAYLDRKAKEAGGRLSGFAATVAKDAGTLQSIARDALRKLGEDT